MSNFTQTVVDQDGNTIVVTVNKPTNEDIKAADIERAKAWNVAFKEGVMTKAEVEKVMRKRGVWTDQKSEREAFLTTQILELERKLYRGDGKSKPKLSKGREIAIEMRQCRAELRDLIQERISFDENTAESLADNARFDYLVFACSFNEETGERLFKSFQDYSDRGSSLIAITSAQLLARMMYDLDNDFEDRLPENQFLKDFNLVDESGDLIDPKTKELIDAEGRRINKLGHYIDEDGNRVDIDGNPIDADGLYERVEYEDDLFEKPKTKRAPRKRTPKKTAKKEETQVEQETSNNG